MAAKAQFESNIASSSKRMYDEQESFYWQNYNYWWSDIIWSITWTIWDLVQFLIIISAIGFSIGSFFFFIYIFISLFKKWWEVTLTEMRSFWKWVINTLSGLFWWVTKKIKNTFSYFYNHKLLSWLLILIIVWIGFIQWVIDGTSRILKLTKINPWYVWVDLNNDTIMTPGYHLYSPLKSWFFLSPTNNFSFDIIDVQANAQEELAVSLAYRVTFKIIDEKRLDLYRNNGAKNIQLLSSDIVMPRMLEVINWIIKNYSFKDIWWKHWEIKTVTITWANKVLQNIWIEIQDLNILSITLPESYIKSKQDLLQAENALKLSQAQLEAQQKLSEKNLLEAENKKKVTIIEAEWLTEYNKIISKQEITSTMIEMKKLEIEEKKIEKWNGIIPQWWNINWL